ncbi:flagellar assembly protein FliH [Motilimonas pumila]|uniref:Flagellar assembly protein FliH n=1 Tax=Motilimonas pumila TaxID=2303987 RepID=A0A418YGU0_9GAMM|nr:flagellar assembly protein FliH [Motilimonas pumila]RJG49024.1 flagellar assembly protein FliH [Motilimonas pumila]
MADEQNPDQRPELWQIPKMEVALETEETNALNMKTDWFKQIEEPVEEEQVPAPPTLEEIEAIRTDAFDEGFKEGQAAGFAKGEEEGRLEGLGKGHEEGLMQGLQQGLELGAEQIATQSGQWQVLTEQLHFPKLQLDKQIELELVQLAMALAQQIVKVEVQTNPQVILAALKQAIDALPFAAQKTTLLLHPDDLVLVKAVFGDEECDKRGWSLQAEPSFNRGDCQVKTDISSVDYPLEMRVNQVLKQFLAHNSEQLNDRPVEPEQQVAATPDVSGDAQPSDAETPTEPQSEAVSAEPQPAISPESSSVTQPPPEPS